ncbi:MAG: STAS domain-containing protein [Candidatus Kapaibacterium sp.]|jgi:anti-sigma B factor antagonist
MSIDEKFKVETEILKHDVLCMKLNGFLDAHTAPILENAVQSAITENNFKIIMNFEKLDYISSAGLGVFMSFIEEIRSNNGDIKMTGMNDKVFTVFDLLGFPMLFDISPNTDELMTKFVDYDNH